MDLNFTLSKMFTAVSKTFHLSPQSCCSSVAGVPWEGSIRAGQGKMNHSEPFDGLCVCAILQHNRQGWRCMWFPLQWNWATLPFSISLTLGFIWQTQHAWEFHLAVPTVAVLVTQPTIPCAHWNTDLALFFLCADSQAPSNLSSVQSEIHTKVSPSKQE